VNNFLGLNYEYESCNKVPLDRPGNDHYHILPLLADALNGVILGEDMNDALSPAGPSGPVKPTNIQPNSNLPTNYKWMVLSTVIFGIFMIILDTTVVNVAFQTLSQEFGGNISNTQWIISIYVLALGITTPLAGFLADRYGGKKIYLGGLGLFALGSLLCGFSPNLNFLIVARAIQGAGGGIAMPLGTALLLQAFPVKEQGTALGIFGIAALVAPAIGPILGGWLVDQNLWRVIFFINPPIGLVGVLLGIRLLREHQSEFKPSFDLAGVITEIIGFGAILYAASIAAERGWTSPTILTWFAIGSAGLILFGIIELFTAKSPLLDLRLFGDRVFLNASLLGYVSTVALFGAEFLMPIYLQALRGHTALQTGFILLPMALTGGIFVTLSGRIYDRVGPRPLMATGFAILMINTWQLSQIQADTAIGWIIFLLALRGMALGLTVQTTLVTALSVVTRDDLARGSSLTNATRLVVQSIGVAVLATVLASAISPDVQALQEQLSQNRRSGSIPTTGLCEPSQITSRDLSGVNNTNSLQRPLASIRVRRDLVKSQLQIEGTLDRACQENIAGFERAYKVTFYAASIALLLGLMLPGWPFKWAGRQEVDKDHKPAMRGMH
jgi:EmrB/QacA subfamily drug resistance transporter